MELSQTHLTWASDPSPRHKRLKVLPNGPILGFYLATVVAVVWGATDNNRHIGARERCLWCLCARLKKAQLEEWMPPPWKKSPGSNMPKCIQQPFLLAAPHALPPGAASLGAAAPGPPLFANKHAVQQVRAPLMNYSAPSISSVQLPDKSQALKWISRLTCLHRAGLSRPHPPPLFFNLPPARPPPSLSMISA